MGDLTGGETSRGQLLIITALALAVLLSVLTLTLNTAVFGGVYVAQTDDGLRAERGAVQYQNAVRRGVAGLIPRLNEQHVEYTTLTDNLTAATANWTALADGEYARDSVATNASVENVTFRSRVVQNTSQDFTDNSSNTSWTLGDDVSNVSGYDMKVSETGLTQTSNCSGNCFLLTVSETGGTGAWEMRLFREGSQGVNLTVVENDGTTHACGTNDPSVSINVTDGTFDDGACTFPSFRDDPGVDPPYTLTYTRANNVTGTYNFTATGRLVSGSIEDDGRYTTTGSPGSPTLDPRIAAANVTVRYGSSTLAYGSRIRVTPGDADG